MRLLLSIGAGLHSMKAFLSAQDMVGYGKSGKWRGKRLTRGYKILGYPLYTEL